MDNVISLGDFKLSDEDMKKAERNFMRMKAKMAAVLIEGGCAAGEVDKMLGFWEDQGLEALKGWASMNPKDIDELRATVEMSDEPPEDFDPDTTTVFDL